MDASVAVKWAVRDEDHVRESLSLLDGFSSGTFDLLAPDHIRYEVSNAVAVAVQRGRLAEERGTIAVAAFLALSLSTYSDDDLLTSAYRLARQYRCSVYDAAYLALALRTNRPLVIADAPFYRRIRSVPLVLWIEDYGRA